MTNTNSQIFDYIIVGGGSAGSVLASRLSEVSSLNIMLIEAGQDTPPGRVPSEILDSFPGLAYLNPRLLWPNQVATTEPRSHNQQDQPRRTRPYEQARVMGGGSSVNGQLANRGAPHDYDEWESRGAKGWNWLNVLPFFQRIEHDLDFDGPYHGKGGPIPISRVFPNLWSGHASAVARQLEKLDFRFLPDQNGPFEDGYFPLTINNAYDRRVSAATGYLSATVRQRSNLTILSETEVTALRFSEKTCVGVDAIYDGKSVSFDAHEVILSAGAINSPAHLMRAGIGPAGELTQMGIQVRQHSPGVGKGLMDHPAVALASFIRPAARINGKTRRHLLLGLRFSSALAGTPQGDMAVAFASKSAWHAVGDRIGVANAWVNKTYSDRGEVRLNSTDWRDRPLVDFSLLSDPRDLDRLKSAFRLVAALMTHADMQTAIAESFPASYSRRVRQIAAVTPRNKVLTKILAGILDGPQKLRAAAIDRLIVDGAPLGSLLADDSELEAFVRETAFGLWHASCSCRMGAEDDPMAVVDSSGQLYGIKGLRVVDASIFPVIPCANTNLPTIMVAERMAELILTQRC